MSRHFRAPGRVNLIGEHTDYNDGFVLPVAIDLACDIRATPNSEGELTVRSRQIEAVHRWLVAEISSARPRRNWSDYVAGVAIQLQQRGVAIPSADLEIDSAVPVGAGLSSSAALEVSSGLALCSLAGAEMELTELAKAGQDSEHEFVGIRCGIMDQFIAALGQRGHALLIDCRSLEYRAVPLPGGLELVMVNTMVHHAHATSEYNTRRAECEQAAETLGRPLRDISVDEWPELESALEDPLRRRARHVVTENQRVLDFVAASERGDLDRMGGLMAEAHESIATDYEVSCPELDALVELAMDAPGIVGSRMTGGGFGGCTVNLVFEDQVDAFVERVARQYQERFGVKPDTYVCQSADGAREILG